MKNTKFTSGVLLAVMSLSVCASTYSLGPVHLSTSNRIAVGAAWRLENRDPDLIGKRNLDPALCAEDDCQSLSGDASRNQELVDAPGGFLAHNMDDGDLNYDRGDMVAGLIKWTGDLSASWLDYNLKLRVIGFYDLINQDFLDSHPNTDYQPARTPRDERVEEQVGAALELHDLVLSVPFFIGDNYYDFSIGQQKIRWGEANILVLNSLNEINPPDGRRLRQPTFQINELFLPVPMAVLSGDIAPDLGLSMQLFYQFGWRAVVADPGGSFYADVDALQRDDAFAPIGIGYQPEDPEGQKRISNPFAALLTDTSFTAPFLTEREPEDAGQYGARLSWFSDFLLDGSEWGFYAMNYHARLPSLSLFATDSSCLREAVAENYAAYAAACEGFALAGGGEPLPLDTIRLFFEYPEDIQMYGISLNTNLGKWSIAGEYSYRPNLPLQVGTTDVFWAGLQPAFPAQDIVFGTQGLLGPNGEILDSALAPVLGPVLEAGGAGFPITVPSARNAVPDFLESLYRGNTVQANQYVPGYERFTVDQLVVNGIRILGSSHPIPSLLGAEQMIWLLEAGVTHVWDMPALDELQLEGGSPNGTHRSGGADGTGMPNGEPDTRRQNPTQQTEGFATQWSMGLRSLIQLQYNGIFGGLNAKPFAVVSYDPKGTAPKPIQNFIENRLDLVLGAEFSLGQHWAGKLQYNMHSGDRHYTRGDRDNVAVEFSYTF